MPEDRLAIGGFAPSTPSNSSAEDALRDLTDAAYARGVVDGRKQLLIPPPEQQPLATDAEWLRLLSAVMRKLSATKVRLEVTDLLDAYEVTMEKDEMGVLIIKRNTPPQTNTSRAPREFEHMTAAELRADGRCVICTKKISVQIFKGTKYCSVDCRTRAEGKNSATPRH